MFEFELPDVGEGVAEGEIVAWHVTEGDEVEEDQVLAEVETDKAVVDLPSPVAGTVRELHAKEGEVVPVGDVVITIDVAGEEPDEVEVEPETGNEAETDETATDDTGETPDGRVFAPPNVRRLARELDVDLAAVDGSGPGGRVTEGDVRVTAEREHTDEETAEAVTESAETGDGAQTEGETASASPGRDGQQAPAVESADRDRTLAAPATRKLAREEGIDIDEVPTEKTRDGEAFVEPEDVHAYGEATATAAAADTEPAEATAGTGPAGEAATADTAAEAGEAPDVTTEPYRGVRRTIGQQMERSAYTAPHVCHHDTAVVDDLVRTRADLKPRAAEQDVRLTYVPFVMKAIVAGLREYPVLNTELDEENEQILYKHYYNIGLAVATDAGLMVPVVEDVDEKGILELAAEANTLAERARNRDITHEEMQGGTFTITNFGAIGGEYATPIINYPETAILGLGAIEQRPVVAETEASATSDDPASTGEVVARHTLPLSLSIDHRVIDGAEAAGFVNTVIEHLENPTLLLLE